MIDMIDVHSELRDLEIEHGEHDFRFSDIPEQAQISSNGKSGLSTVQKAMKARLERLEIENGSFEEGDSFFVVDLDYVQRQYASWTQRIPRAVPHYAVKCNTDLPMINLLESLGAGFDCASSNEMQLILSQGIQPGRIVFSNPCKMKQDLRLARRHDIRKTVFDNADELYKIKSIFPEALLFIRIYASDKTAMYDLSEKFGASEESAKSLLRLATKLSLNVTGVSFHVGSGAIDPQAFVNAIHQSRILFNYGRTLGLAMKSLDIGGGFSEATFPLVSAHVTHSLNDIFPEDVEILGEPGRFFAEGAMTLACNVMARRCAKDPFAEGAVEMLYLNDGIYSNFLSSVFEPSPIPQVLYGDGDYFPDQLDRENIKATSTYVIWGPTCDACDFINKGIKLRKGLKIGDWLYYTNSGAYSSSLSTTFNGFLNQFHSVYVGTTSTTSSFLRDQKSLEDSSRSSIFSPND